MPHADVLGHEPSTPYATVAVLRSGVHVIKTKQNARSKGLRIKVSEA